LLESLKSFKLEFYFLAIISALVYSFILPYINFSTQFILETYYSNVKDLEGIQIKLALETGIIFVISTFLNPIIGYIQKIYGMRPMLLLISCTFGIFAIIILFKSPGIGLIFLGISYSILASVVWSTVGILNQEKYLVNFY